MKNSPTNFVKSTKFSKKWHLTNFDNFFQYILFEANIDNLDYSELSFHYSKRLVFVIKTPGIVEPNGLKLS